MVAFSSSQVSLSTSLFRSGFDSYVRLSERSESKAASTMALWSVRSLVVIMLAACDTAYETREYHSHT